MSKKLYVGNLPHSVNDAELKEVFEAYGEVTSAQVIVDRESHRSKGFGFVEMGSAEEAESAIQALNGNELQGRALTVNVARPKEDRPQGGGFRGGNRHGGGKRY